jgi:hypothetical protein
MGFARGFVIVLFTAFTFGAIGAMAGYLLGEYDSDFIRLALQKTPDYGPVEYARAGFGFGLVQGVWAGILSSLVIILAVSWYESRRQRG